MGVELRAEIAVRLVHLGPEMGGFPARNWGWSRCRLLIRYQMLGMFLLVQLCNIAAEGLRRSNLASIIVSVQHTSLRVHQASGGFKTDGLI
ncbi:Peroxisome biogenesis factor 10 [Artemisia annua]|uniref:Peroxisome biogenesis factor 10 n=1 Tax=Artemisia annua TaxID=35608 RepID=A0A2U1NI55_ARTAN|nr:Peroxisome biogenesis factor 10 [Artemisia annua]